MSAPLHASCVTFGDRGALITGPSGAGKSALALQLLSRGGRLVADDRVIVTPDQGCLLARSPAPIAGLLEARKFAILNAPTQDNAQIVCLVDLAQSETDRLPPLRKITQSGVELDLFFGKDTPNLADALTLYLRYGRHV